MANDSAGKAATTVVLTESEISILLMGCAAGIRFAQTTPIPADPVAAEETKAEITWAISVFQAMMGKLQSMAFKFQNTAPTV